MTHTTRIDNLIKQHCPNGVRFVSLGSLGVRSKGTPITASRMKILAQRPGPLRIFAGGQTIADVQESAIPEKDIIRVPSIIVKSRGHIGFTYYDQPFSHKSEIWSYSISNEKANQKFVYYYLLTQTRKLQEAARANSVKLPQLSVAHTDTLKIPVPPLVVQEEIVRILDTFTQLEAELEAELAARRQQYEHYRSSTLDEVAGRSTHVRLGDLGRVQTGRTPKAADYTSWGDAVNFVTPSDLRDEAKIVSDTARKLSDIGANLMGQALIPARSILVTCIGAAMGKTVINEAPCVTNQQINSIVLSDTVDADYLFHVLSSMRPALLTMGQRGGGTMPLINKTDFSDIKVPIPDLECQRDTAAMLDKFENLANGLDAGLPAEIVARRQQYEYYRDRLLSFEELQAPGDEIVADLEATK